MPSVPPRTAESDALARELSAVIEGEVLTDRVSRGLYATDASIYQIPPLAVVLPRTREDVRKALMIARRRALAVLPRGGGTSLSGQTTGRALVLDLSKHMNRVLEVDRDGRWVRVEPGRVRDELNAHLADTGLEFAPETATSNRAAIGGMIGNNSAGTKSITYGKTVDHVLELTVILATGEELVLGPKSPDEWDHIAARDDREGQLYRGVRAIIQAHEDEIAARYPKVMRQVGGYNLNEFVAGAGGRASESDPGPWNLAKLIVGSEGTLATVVEAKLRLQPIPAARVVTVVPFEDLLDALATVPRIVAHRPSAVELLDRTVLQLALGNLEASRQRGFVQGDPAAILIVELAGDDPAGLEERLDRLREELPGATVIRDPEAQAKVWEVRKSGLGLMLGMKRDAKPLPFIEDSAVPVEHLRDYIAEVRAICEELGVEAAMYAHASVGLIHVRPILNLKLPRDIERMKEISARTFELVRKYGGSWSGEHGDGLVRSYQNERYFGPTLYQAFREIKTLFDPAGLMNPGKIVDAPAMDQNLRLGPEYRAEPRPTFYHYREDQGFDRAVEMCTGVGACRKTLGGTMCPSYIATRDEAHSTRGRANALRLALSGQLGPDGMTSDALHDVLDLCLGCKACKAECPSNVDLAKLKGEFLAGYHQERGATAAERFFAQSARVAARVAGPLAAAANWSARQLPTRLAMERLLGVDRRRRLPEFATEPFPRWFKKRRRQRATKPDAPRVALFADTYLSYHEPEIGRAAVALLEAAGFEVDLAQAGCCGRPLISHGFLEDAKRHGVATLQMLDAILRRGTPIVVCEPSCLSALTDDLPDLVDDAGLGKKIQAGLQPLDRFLAAHLDKNPAVAEELRARAGDGRLLLHGHCHQKALTGTASVHALCAHLGASAEEIDSGCCGMAGSFGYETRHYDLSLKIGEDRLFPAVRAMSPGTTLVASGFSCRHQLADATDTKAKALVVALADHLGLER